MKAADRRTGLTDPDRPALGHPVLYEVNTRCWLRRLSEEAGRPISLQNVPERELAAWKRSGFSHIWLMGVWTSGPKARQRALSCPRLRAAYDQAFPGWSEQDITGSPYAIANYTVPEPLGGETGLADFRERLNAAGMSLVVDFVPNHLGLDHPWLQQRPELFVQNQTRYPESFPQETPAGQVWIAHGKDPNFPAWTDTAQVNLRQPEARKALSDLLLSIARRADGVRCDMAMLLLNDVFEKTWARLPGRLSGHCGGTEPMLKNEFWREAIARARQSFPSFMFVAEAYWGLEEQLCWLGFDYAYDKVFYDHLVAGNPALVQRHLLELSPRLTSCGVRFLENHDELRVAALLNREQHRAAAWALMSSSGMVLLHEGQLSGAKRRLPAQLQRAASEPADPDVQRIYEEIFQLLPGTAIRKGTGKFLRPQPVDGRCDGAENVIVVLWEAQPARFSLVAVNLGGTPSACVVPVNLQPGNVVRWNLSNLLGQGHVRTTDKLLRRGLRVDLPAYGTALYHGEPDG